MAAFIKSLSPNQIDHAKTRMIALSSGGCFKRFITIDEPCVPDTAFYHCFGSLPDVDRRFDRASRRQVRCSPELSAFLLGCTGYAHPPDGPNPEMAMSHLFEACFRMPKFMFLNDSSPYQLMARSHNIIDLAFVRAVLTASQWLGLSDMLIGHIADWPPQQPAGDTGL